MIAKHAPIFETCDRVFDARSPASMPPPVDVAKYTTASKSRRDKVRDTAVATIGEHATVIVAQRFDVRAAVVHDVVAVPRTTSRDT
ncbi:MAG TPA: hypothetical protein VIU61_03245, partial [Kofleriaceae bacterium]